MSDATPSIMRVGVSLITRTDLKRGDIMLARADILPKLPLQNQLFCGAILLGEKFMQPKGDYFHVAVVDTPTTAEVLEEELNGEIETVDDPCGAAWDIVRYPFGHDQLEAFLACLKSKLGTAYALWEFPIIAGVRVLHMPLNHADWQQWVCSNAVAQSLDAIGIRPWAPRGIDSALVVPSDYPGDGMKFVSKAGVLVAV
jgi:hypothetical protein